MTPLDLNTVSPALAEQVEALRAAHGDVALLTFPTVDDVRNYLRDARPDLQDWQPTGFSRDGVSWYMLRPQDASVRTTPPRSVPGRQGTAKELCLSVYVEGIERNAFVAAAVALGVKESTAKTMYSDIKSGRIR